MRASSDFRVAPGDHSPRPSPDPDLEISTIRLFADVARGSRATTVRSRGDMLRGVVARFEN